MKICLVCSAGGHLTELLQIRKAFEKYEHFFVTFDREDVKSILKKEKKYSINDPKRNPAKFIKNFFQSLKIFLKENPDIIISTGAGMAICMCYIAKIFRKKIIYIESLAAVGKPSFSGRIIYHAADIFIVQWKELKKYYPKAVYGGRLI